MTATDELRRLLDGRGVEWRGGLPTETMVDEPLDLLYVERPDGTLRVFVRSYLTPAQAVEATLGRGTCEMLDGGYGSPFVCSECGAEFNADVIHGDVNYCPNCGRKVVNA